MFPMVMKLGALVVLILVFEIVNAKSSSCRDFVVRARLDNVPTDFVVEITNNSTGNREWRSQPVTDAFAEIIETTCLDPSECWKATVFDSALNKDGLTALDEDDDIPGGYYLTFGSEKVGSYDGTLHPQPCYEQHWYIFGDGCKTNFAPTEGMVAESSCLHVTQDAVQGNETMCVRFELEATSDDFPQDSWYILRDEDGTILWDEAARSQIGKGEHFAKTTCLDSSKCYRFTFFDSVAFPTNLTGTSHQDMMAGSFSLLIDDQVVGSYDGPTDGCFSAKWFQFGRCPGGESSGTFGANECSEPDFSEQQEPPPSPCDPFSFSIFTDEYPMDVSYKLTNIDGKELWNVKTNTLRDQNSLYERQTCLDTDDCYTFALYDSEMHQDGLTEVPTGGVAGWYRLDYQGSPISYYDGSKDGCYRAKGFRFGDRCPVAVSNKWSAHGECQARPDVYQSSEEKDVGCVGFQFYLLADRFPEHSRIHLNDSYGAVIWDERIGGPGDANRLFDRDICLNPFDCYNFTLYDSELQSDGLTIAPVNGTPGMFNLTYGFDLIGAYDGAQDGCFSAAWFLFGEMCQTEVVKARIAGSSCQSFSSEVDSEAEALEQIPHPIEGADGCTPLMLILLHDEFPEDIDIMLETDSGKKIWDFHHRWNPKHAGETFAETVCLDSSLCYRFQIDDIYGDGLTKPTELGAGQFSLVYGTSVIELYDGTSCFSMMWYQFGASCEQEKVLEGGSCEGPSPVEPNGIHDCGTFAFAIQLDEFPEDVVIALNTTSGQEIWSHERPWGPQDAGKSFEQIECLSETECFVFSVFDEYDDGLTKTITETGSFNVTYKGELIGSYDARADECYSVYWFQFGSGCDFFPQTIAVSEEVKEGDCRDERRRLTEDSS